MSRLLYNMLYYDDWFIFIQGSSKQMKFLLRVFVIGDQDGYACLGRRAPTTHSGTRWSGSTGVLHSRNKWDLPSGGHKVCGHICIGEVEKWQRGGQRIDNGRTNAGGISACCAKGPVHWREDKSNIPTLIDRNIKWLPTKTNQKTILYHEQTPLKLYSRESWDRHFISTEWE